MYDDWAHGQDKRRSSHPHGGAPQHQAPHTYGGYGTRSYDRPAYPHPSVADRGGDRHHGRGSGGKGGGGRFTQWEDNRHSNNNRRHSHNRSHHDEGRKGGKGGGGASAGAGGASGHWNPFATHTGTNFKVQDDADAETARKSAGIEADFNFEEAKIDMEKLKEEIPEEEKPQDGYDKKKSFFDMLSCETSDKNKEANKERYAEGGKWVLNTPHTHTHTHRVPKNQREVMRTADISTFGAEAVRAIESSFVRERGQYVPHTPPPQLLSTLLQHGIKTTQLSFLFSRTFSPPFFLSWCLCHRHMDHHTNTKKQKKTKQPGWTDRPPPTWRLLWRKGRLRKGQAGRLRKGRVRQGRRRRLLRLQGWSGRCPWQTVMIF